MALTKRAVAWLATLSRETPVPTVRIESLIVAAGAKPHASWLEFHDKYAGYIEEVGPGDIAIWGLARSATAIPEPIWVKPDTVTIRPADRHFPEAIFCADSHPVHGYELGADGAFYGLGGPAATFEMKLERHGVMKEFYDRGRVKRTLVTRKADEAQHQELLHSMEHALVHEASDQAMKFYLEPTRLLRFHPFAKAIELYELDVR